MSNEKQTQLPMMHSGVKIVAAIPETWKETDKQWYWVVLQHPTDSEEWPYAIGLWQEGKSYWTNGDYGHKTLVSALTAAIEMARGDK